MQAIIMAGGKGTRLKPLADITPKLLLTLDNKPLIDYIINHLRQNGCDNIIICTGYLGDKVQNYIARKNFGPLVKQSREDRPLGTAGPLHLIKGQLENEFFLLYGDVYTTINLKMMLQFHKQKDSDATLAVHTSDHPQDSTVVRIGQDGKLLNFIEKPGDNWKKYGNVTNAVLYILKKGVLDFIEENKEVDFAADVFPLMLKKGKKLFGYVTKEYTKDIGTKVRYDEVRTYLMNSKAYMK